jgi:hypothetical protein
MGIHRTLHSEPAPVEDSSGPENVDYPRPAVPGEENVDHPNPPLHTDEEAPLKKEKKHSNHEKEKKLKEREYRKIEATMPTRDMLGGKGGFGAAGRIAQPAGRGLA